MTKANDGTAFQQDFQEALAWIQEHEKAVWHRFVDTKAARNYVAEQPGDFMLLTGGVAHLFELKSTVDKVPLKEFLRTKTGLRQVAQARKWERGGGQAWFALCEKPPKGGWVSVYTLWDITEGAGSGQDAKPRYQCSLSGLRAMLWCLFQSTPRRLGGEESRIAQLNEEGKQWTETTTP
jgi:hypothetical protein